MRRLIAMRHARAVDHSDSGRDRDRPLSAEGRADASAQAQRLKALGIVPDRLLTSPAERAVETAARVSEILAPGLEPEPVAAVYEAPAGELIEVLEEYPGDEVLLVGHNPTLSELASWLGGERVGLSAGGFAVLEFDPPATHPLQPARARVAHHQPRPDT